MPAISAAHTLYYVEDIIMGAHESYQQKYEAQLCELDAEIQQLERQAEQSQAGTKIAYYKELQSLYEKRAKAVSNLQALNKARGDIWESVKGEVEAAWHELQSGVHSAAARFKEH